MSLALPPEPVLPTVAGVFDTYTALTGVIASQLSGRAGGRLLAVFNLDAEGVAAIVAGCVAGAAVLAVDADPNRTRQMLRLGICDFVVNDLDEALRILKNEVRKKQPVSVCLAVELEACAQQMVERGLQPDLLAGVSGDSSAVLQQRGALPLAASAGPPEGMRVVWRYRNAGAFVPLHVLTQADHLAADALDPRWASTPARRTWLERAPRYLGRKLAAQRSVRMSGEESARFEAALAQDTGLAAQVEIRVEGMDA